MDTDAPARTPRPAPAPAGAARRAHSTSRAPGRDRGTGRRRSDADGDGLAQRQRHGVVADEPGAPLAVAAGALENDLARGRGGGAPGLPVALRQQAPRPVT